jgi:hypothetical protein
MHAIKVTGFDEQRYSECARFILDQARVCRWQSLICGEHVFLA